MTVSQVASELGINANILGRWRRQLDHRGTNAFPRKGLARDEEMAKLKREVARVKKERDFL